MCRVLVSKKLNPSFVLYNVVFGSNTLKRIDAPSLQACMGVYGVEMSESEIQDKISTWHRSGLLRLRNGKYVVA